MPLIYGIDPGTEQTAIVCWNGSRISLAYIYANGELLRQMRSNNGASPTGKHFAIENITHMGEDNPVGASVFETVRMIGRLEEAIETRNGRVTLIPRMTIKLHVCGRMGANDQQIRSALIERFGEKGTKAKGNVNPITGQLSSHLWQAFAVAVTAFDKLK